MIILLFRYNRGHPRIIPEILLYYYIMVAFVYVYKHSNNNNIVFMSDTAALTIIQ